MIRSLFRWLFGGDPEEASPAITDAAEEEDRQHETDGEPDEILLEITDVLDLHSFPPREVKDVVRDYLDAAAEKGLRSLRIIHGRGMGVQRRAVRSLLERDPRVVDFGDAPAEGGGWGATLVELRADDEDPDPPS